MRRRAIDLTLRPDFCLGELSPTQWRHPALRRLLMLESLAIRPAYLDELTILQDATQVELETLLLPVLDWALWGSFEWRVSESRNPRRGIKGAKGFRVFRTLSYPSCCRIGGREEWAEIITLDKKQLRAG